MELENNQEQPHIEDSQVSDNQPETNKEDGNELTFEELEKRYKSLQSDYTKKTQELSSLKKGQENLGEEDLKAKVDELASFKQAQLEKEEFKTLTDSVNLSETQLKMVQDLKKVNTDKSLLEIANDYWMIDEAKLNKYKWSFDAKGKSFALPAKEEPYKVDVTKAGYNPEMAAELSKMRF